MIYFADIQYLSGKKERKSLKTLLYNPERLEIMSIGIVTEDGTSHYWVSKDFDLKEAWNRFEHGKTYKIVQSTTRTKEYVHFHNEKVPINYKKYYIRDTVLSEIHTSLFSEYCMYDMKHIKNSYKNLKYLIDKYGKTNEEIAKDIKSLIGMTNKTGDKYIFCFNYKHEYEDNSIAKIIKRKYMDCMIMIDELINDYDNHGFMDLYHEIVHKSLIYSNMLGCIQLDEEIINDSLKKLMAHEDFPNRINKYNALSNAMYNRDIYNFLKTIK